MPLSRVAETWSKALSLPPGVSTYTPSNTTSTAANTPPSQTPPCPSFPVSPLHTPHPQPTPCWFLGPGADRNYWLNLCSSDSSTHRGWLTPSAPKRGGWSRKKKKRLQPSDKNNNNNKVCFRGLIANPDMQMLRTVTFKPRTRSNGKWWTKALWLSLPWGWCRHWSRHVNRIDLSYSFRPLVKGFGHHL